MKLTPVEKLFIFNNIQLRNYCELNGLNIDKIRQCDIEKQDRTADNVYYFKLRNDNETSEKYKNVLVMAVLDIENNKIEFAKTTETDRIKLFAQEEI